jgi:hypothetical protein
MKITVRTESYSQNIIEINKVRLKLHFKNVTRALMMLGGLSLLFLVIGISGGDKYSMINTGSKKIYYNLNLFTSLGISSILVLLYVVRQLNRSKKNFMKAMFQIAEKFDGVNELSYEFTDSHIIIDHGAIYERINWNLFAKKTFHEKYIFLNFSDQLMDGIAINGNLFDDADFIAITKLIDQKFENK